MRYAETSDAASAVTIAPKRKLPDGKVRIWSVEHQRYMHFYPIDAKEKIFFGGPEKFLLDRPGDEPAPASPRPKAPETVPPSAAAKVASPIAQASASAGQGYPFEHHTLPELKAFASDANIDGHERMKKIELVRALESRNYVPPGLRRGAHR